MFERKCLAKVKKMMGTKIICKRMFLKCLCIPFIKGLMINVRKMI